MDIQSIHAKKKVEYISPYVGHCKTILDFGCGDLSFAIALKKRISSVKITGVDVVDFGVRPMGISYRNLSGSELPFGPGSFDAVVSYHVFHHTTHPISWFSECVRVAKRYVLFVEPVYRHIVELPGMIFMDWLFNVSKYKRIPMTYKFYSQDFWERKIQDNACRLIHVKDVELLPKIFPTGRSLLFVVER